MGSLYRVRNLCQGLIKMDHRCYIFTPFNYSEEWGPNIEFITIPTLGSGGKKSKLAYKIIRKILDSRLFSRFTILNPKLLNLTISRISQSLYEIINEKAIKLDTIIGETEVGGLIVLKIKDKLKIPVIVDYQNYWPEELVEQNIIKRKSKRFTYLVNLENEIIEQADLIITPSRALKEFLIKEFDLKDRKKVKSVINGGSALLEMPKQKTFPPKIINAGMVVHRSNLKLFLESIPFVLSKYPNSRIYITRKGEKLQEIMNFAKEINIDNNIEFYWKETYQEFLDLLSECHVGVVTSSFDLTRKLGFVTKIYDYFSVGVPVVGNDIGGWTSIISEEKVGLLSTNDPKDLADKMMQLIKDPDMSYEYGKRGIELLKGRYSETEAARKLVEVIEMVLQ